MSEMVSYVLLIIMAIGLSVIVFAFLSVYVPKEKPECKEDVHVAITKTLCNMSNTNQTLTLELTNKGLFTFDAAYIRMAPAGREVTFLINDPEKNLGGSVRGFQLYAPGATKPGLPPGAQYTRIYSLANIEGLTDSEGVTLVPGTYTLEVQPAMGKGKNFALCEKAIIHETIRCTA
jgi:hypothetical protein